MIVFLLLALVCASAGVAPLLKHETTVDRVQYGVEQRQYIVLFNNMAPKFGDKETLITWASQFQGVDVLHYYQILDKFHGFAAWMTRGALPEIRQLDIVDYVEEDQWVFLNFTMEAPLLKAATRVPVNPSWQARVDWGQKRINSRTWALDTKPSQTYSSRPPATYANSYANTTSWDWADTNYKVPSNGQKAVVWIVDTGVRATHDEFKRSDNSSRVTFLIDFVGDGQVTDGNGHGTHCAGTAAGNYRGVAKEAEIRSVRVLNNGGSGTWAGVIAGFDYVANNQVHGKANILSASLGGGATQSVDDATNAAVSAGVIAVVAAGNSNNNACGVGGIGGNSPARAELAITVVASDSADQVASFSSYGPCSKSIAPGVIITSAWIPPSGQPANDDWYNDISGTSMATPHVAGAIAVYVSEEGVAIDPDSVKAALATDQTPGLVGGLTGAKATTPNVLLYSQWKLA